MMVARHNELDIEFADFAKMFHPFDSLKSAFIPLKMRS